MTGSSEHGPWQYLPEMYIGGLQTYALFEARMRQNWCLENTFPKFCSTTPSNIGQLARIYAIKRGSHG